MHTGNKFGPGNICKCMDCAGQRFVRAEQEARTCAPDDFFELQREEDQLQRNLTHAQDALKVVKNDKYTLIMTYYHKLTKEDNDGKA